MTGLRAVAAALELAARVLEQHLRHLARLDEAQRAHLGCAPYKGGLVFQ